MYAITADMSPTSTITIPLKLGPMGFGSSLYGAVLPHWFLVAIVGLLGVAPRLLWRFSLRTLLIAMTLVAVVLGALVYSMR
jgi:hypothetical protein